MPGLDRKCVCVAGAGAGAGGGRVGVGMREEQQGMYNLYEFLSFLKK